MKADPIAVHCSKESQNRYGTRRRRHVMCYYTAVCGVTNESEDSLSDELGGVSSTGIVRSRYS